MERLTKDKRTMCIVEDNQNKNYFNQIHDKLSKLEDLEEELGIPLEVLFEGLKQRKIYVESYFYLELEEEQDDNRIPYYYIETIEYCDNDDSCYEYCKGNWLLMFREDEYGNECVVRLKDYGKTWALTKEELE